MADFKGRTVVVTGGTGGLGSAVVGALLDAGAFIIGRNMFGPRGAEYDHSWQGWWGDDPPYHAPVFVLTHRARDPLEMKGGTTFYFVTNGIESALEQARKAAGERDVSVMGGADTVNQFLRAGLLDELWLHVAPIVYGDGKRLFEGESMQGLEVLEMRPTPIGRCLCRDFTQSDVGAFWSFCEGPRAAAGTAARGTLEGRQIRSVYRCLPACAHS